MNSNNNKKKKNNNNNNTLPFVTLLRKNTMFLEVLKQIVENLNTQSPQESRNVALTVAGTLEKPKCAEMRGQELANTQVGGLVHIPTDGTDVALPILLP